MDVTLRKAAAQDRVATAKSGRPGKPWLDSHVTWKHGQIWEVVCKGCGAVIRHMAPDDKFRVREVINNKPVIVERLMLICLPNYREMLMEFDDGTKHVTTICDECSQTVSAADLEAFYVMDLAQMKADGVTPSEREVSRKPLRVKRVAAVIQGDE